MFQNACFYPHTWEILCNFSHNGQMNALNCSIIWSRCICFCWFFSCFISFQLFNAIFLCVCLLKVVVIWLVTAGLIFSHHNFVSIENVLVSIALQFHCRFMRWIRLLYGVGVRLTIFFPAATITPSRLPLLLLFRFPFINASSYDYVAFHPFTHIPSALIPFMNNENLIRWQIGQSLTIRAGFVQCLQFIRIFCELNIEHKRIYKSCGIAQTKWIICRKREREQKFLSNKNRKR